MKSLKCILLFLSLSSLLHASSSTKIEEFDSLEKKATAMFSVINNGVKRNVYDILSEYKNPKAKLIQKWFNVASQVTDNENIGYFIKKTKYKVAALVEQLLFDSKKAMTERDRKVLRSKFKFLATYSKKKFTILNQKCHPNKEIYLRTMPIVVQQTKKKTSAGLYMVLHNKTPLNLLYKITYSQEGKIARWGYVESKIDGRRGWINLKNTNI